MEALSLEIITGMFSLNALFFGDITLWSRAPMESEKLKDPVPPFTPEWAEKVACVPAGDIVEATRTYATRKPAIIEWGVAIEQNTNSLQTVRAMALVRALTGNIDIPGGDILGMNVIRAYPTLKDKFP